MNTDNESTGTIVFQHPTHPKQNLSISYTDSEWNSDPWTTVIPKSTKKTKKTKKLNSSANGNSSSGSLDEIPSSRHPIHTQTPSPDQD